MSYAIKTLLAALLIVAASEAGKRFPAMGAMIISLPLASMIVMGFMYYDTRNAEKVAEFARAMPPVLIPSILFFYGYGFFIESGMGFVMAMVLATLLMLAGYAVFMYFFARNGI